MADQGKRIIRFKILSTWTPPLQNTNNIGYNKLSVTAVSECSVRKLIKIL